MAQILVRDIEDEVKDRLQQRAARHGRSMEAEVRDILRDAVKDEGEMSGGLGTEIAALFADIGLGDDEEIAELHDLVLERPFKE